MTKLTQSLLAGSGITEKSHPILVNLLEVAAARPDPPLETAAERRRFSRQWEAVREVFEKCVAAGVTDEDFRGLVVMPWQLCLAPLQVRPAVSGVLEQALASKRVQGAGNGLSEPLAGCRGRRKSLKPEKWPLLAVFPAGLDTFRVMIGLDCKLVRGDGVQPLLEAWIKKHLCK